MSKKYNKVLNASDIKEIADIVINDLRDLVRQQIDLAFKEKEKTGVLPMCGPTKLILVCAQHLDKAYMKHYNSLNEEEKEEQAQTGFDILQEEKVKRN